MSAKLPPPAHTPLAALPAVSLDFETTGLDVRRDRIVQIGAVALHGAEILETPRIDQLLDPGMPIPPAVTRIHGISDAAVAGKPGLADFFEALTAVLAGRVVVGHHIAFDLAVLRHEAARLGLPWRDPPSLDIALLMASLDPHIPDLGLETVTGHLGVSIAGRHSAIGDSMAVAQAFAAMHSRLRQADVRTLGEAMAFATRRSDLILRQSEAGWHAQPGVSSVPAEERPAVRIDSHVFERRLYEAMSAPALFADPGMSLRQAAKVMVEGHVGALLVGRPDRPPEGIVTERDLLRRAADGFPGGLDSTRLTAVMTTPVECMDAGEMLYRALARMDRMNIRHLCVTDERGLAVGMVSQRDLLHHRTRLAIVLDDTLATAEDTAALAAAYARVPEVAGQLVSEGLTGLDVARVVSGELRALYGRAAELALDWLAADGRGKPPAPWSLLLLGSAGRGESLLGADQDNALIHGGTDADDPWFQAFGGLIADYLDESGVTRCKGGVMAVNPEWRGTQKGWRERVDKWLVRADPKDLLNVDIFFDLVPVAGDADLGRRLRADAVEAASRTPPFLSLMAQSVRSFAPRFAMLGQLRVEDGRADLKRDGLLPLVSFARALALRIGSTAHATPDRLRDAADAGRIGGREAETLIEIHVELLSLILQQQLIDLRDGIRPSSRVAVKALPREVKTRLKDRLHRLAAIVEDVRSVMTR